MGTHLAGAGPAAPAGRTLPLAVLARRCRWRRSRLSPTSAPHISTDLLLAALFLPEALPFCPQWPPERPCVKLSPLHCGIRIHTGWVNCILVHNSSTIMKLCIPIFSAACYRSGVGRCPDGQRGLLDNSSGVIGPHDTAYLDESHLPAATTTCPTQENSRLPVFAPRFPVCVWQSCTHSVFLIRFLLLSSLSFIFLIQHTEGAAH